jgi:hypothetical protein
MENLKDKLNLIESIIDRLRIEDEAIAKHLDFSKSDEEIISSMEFAELLKFSKVNSIDD